MYKTYTFTSEKMAFLMPTTSSSRALYNIGEHRIKTGPARNVTYNVYLLSFSDRLSSDRDQDAAHIYCSIPRQWQRSRFTSQSSRLMDDRTCDRQSRPALRPLPFEVACSQLHIIYTLSTSLASKCTCINIKRQRFIIT